MKSETYTVTVTETVETTFIIRLPKNLNDAQVLERVKITSCGAAISAEQAQLSIETLPPFGRCARDELGFRNDPQDG